MCLRSKVKDLGKFNVTLAPADYGSWQSARDTLMSEAKHGLRASLDSEMAALGNSATEESLAALKDKFQVKERDIEHGIDHTVHTFTAAYDLVRTFKPRISPPPLTLTAPFPTPFALGSRTTSSRSERCAAAREREREKERDDTLARKGFI